jgi:nitrogen fixation NifU-like protein
MRTYSAQTVDHFTNPRNMGQLPRPDVMAEVTNPCCGDRLSLSAHVRDGRIVACKFLAYGCATTIAVGSLLTEAIVGTPIDHLDHFDESHLVALAGGLSPGQRHGATLGKNVLEKLAGNYRVAFPKGGGT